MPASEAETVVPSRDAADVPRATLTVIDNRTGARTEIPIGPGTIPATALRAIRARPDDFGLMSYDSSLANTAVARSAITFVDGDAGVLLYRGYPIEQLAEHGTYLETAYLLLFGELPTADQLASWRAEITRCCASLMLSAS